MKNILKNWSNIFFASYYAMCVYVQLNDPDPLIWIAFYSMAFFETAALLFQKKFFKKLNFMILIASLVLLIVVLIEGFVIEGFQEIAETFSEIGGCLIVFFRSFYLYKKHKTQV